MKLKNKIIGAVIVVVIITFATLSAVHIFGTDETVNVKYPKGFTVITTADDVSDNEEFVEAMGYSTDSFWNHLKQKNVVSFAANKDNSSQFALIERETDLSKQLYDISETTDKEVKNIATALVKSGFSGIWRVGGRTFLEVTTSVEEGGNSFCSVQYITIVGGKYYSLNYYGSQKTLTENDKKLISKTIESIEIKDDDGVFGTLTSADTGRILYMILVALVIVVGAVFIVLLISSIMRDYLKKRRSGESDSIRIKRRK